MKIVRNLEKQLMRLKIKRTTKNRYSFSNFKHPHNPKLKFDLGQLLVVRLPFCP